MTLLNGEHWLHTCGRPRPLIVVHDDETGGDTWTQEIDSVAATEFVLSIKSAVTDSDDAAIVLLSSTGGLERVNGASHGTPSDGSITHTDGVATATLKSSVTDDLAAGEYLLTFKALASGADKTWENAAKLTVKVGGVVEVTV